MNYNEHFNLDKTKQVCTCSSLSIFLIILFVISPLKKYIITSFLMKMVTLTLLIYAFYLNILQTNYLRTATTSQISGEIHSQLIVNIVCSYVFTFFIGLLILFIVKTFF